MKENYELNTLIGSSNDTYLATSTEYIYCKKYAAAEKMLVVTSALSLSSACKPSVSSERSPVLPYPPLKILPMKGSSDS